MDANAVRFWSARTFRYRFYGGEAEGKGVRVRVRVRDRVRDRVRVRVRCDHDYDHDYDYDDGMDLAGPGRNGVVAEFMQNEPLRACGLKARLV